MSNQSWSIVIFCYNECESVSRVYESVKQVLDKMQVQNHEVIIVDDGSNDGSKEVISKLRTENPSLITIIHENNKGIGQALRSGYFAAKNENICAVPADGQFDVEELLPYANISENEFISFFRKENTTYSMARNVLSHANKMVNKFLNGFYMLDVNWVKIYKREKLINLNLELQSSLIESEICAKLIKTNNKPQEVVSKYLARTHGVSKGASGKIVWQALKDTMQLFWVLRGFRKASINN